MTTFVPRRWRLLAASLVLLATGCMSSRADRSASPAVAYENGWWFTGTLFERRTMYVADGRFVARPTRIESVVDLAGGYVVPPFAEAHNHNVEPSSRVDAVLASYLTAGVFYVQNPNSLPRTRAALGDRINQPGRLDATFAYRGLTGPGGHPAQIATRNVTRGSWPAEDAEGGFFVTVSDAASLDRAWKLLLREPPDLVKIYLLYSDEYAARLRDPSTVDWRGLDPALVPEIVRRARAAGLRVAAHVETAHDFHVAVAAGVDQIAHMPGFRGDAATALPDPSRFEIREADARLAGEREIVVVTTLSGLAGYADEEGNVALRQAADQLNRRNLELLRKQGVPLAMGSDDYGDTSVREALYLHELAVFTPAALLQMWSETTARAIFPNRRIGRLQPGYEASFLTLAGNPLTDFGMVKQIKLRVKQGRVIEVAR